jgi:type II secretory pathway pseudopilin PulG
MKPSNTAGFTIIETMLFLAITALLIVGVLAGTGSSINTQRYRDSITSLQAFFQQQFSNVSNVSNDRNNDWSCDSSSIITSQTPGNGVDRGQSDCVILGEYITTTNNSQTLSIKSVVGYIPPDSTLASNDLDAIKQYKIKVSPVVSDTYDIEWNASLAIPGNDNPSLISILIVRSPLSGVIRTFIDSTQVVADNDVASLVSQAALTQSVKVCVNSNGLAGGNRMAVVIDAGATSASSIETLGDNSGC